MSNFTPVDFAGNPLFQPVSFPELSYRKATADRRFLNVTGDTMQADLDLGNHKIINLKSPVNKNDATNKSYIDSKFEYLKALITAKVVERVTKHESLIDEIVRKAADNSRAVTSKFLQLSEQLTSFKGHLKFKRFQTVLTNTKGISNFIFSLKDLDVTKNFVIVQIFLETTPGAWYSLFFLAPTYNFRVYQFKEKLFILCESSLPKEWTRKLSVVYQIRQ